MIFDIMECNRTSLVSLKVPEKAQTLLHTSQSAIIFHLKKVYETEKEKVNQS